MNDAFSALIAAAALVGLVSPNDAPPPQKTWQRLPGSVDVICMPREAKAADVTPGKAVRDSSSDKLLLGSVALVGPDSAVVTGEYGSLRFPLQAFGEWCDGSLLLRMSPRQFKKLVEQHSN